MLSVCWFKYRPHAGYRSTFSAHAVNTAFAGFARHYGGNFQPVCITDDAEGLDPDIRVVPIWPDLADIPNPHGNHEPRCYRRLKLFHPETARAIGDRLLWLDLDIVFTGPLDRIFDRPEPIVLLPGSSPRIPFNGSMLLMDAGCRPEVWSSFDPCTAPARNKAAGCAGSDQGQISWCLRERGEARWRIGPDGDGIYFYGAHLKPVGGLLPIDSRLVSFHGKNGDPWSPQMQALPWVRAHWR
jgi:hypothetical protein